MNTEPQSAALDYTIDLCENLTGQRITVGALPSDGGISCEINAGYQTAVYLDKQHRQRTLPLLFLCKNKSQKTAFNTLFAIGNYLDRMTEFNVSGVSGGSPVQICGYELKTEAGFIGKEGDYFIYSIIVDMKIYY